MTDAPDTERMLDDHRRPSGLDDATVAAVGRLTEALETVERARGRLFDFHQLTGEADFKIEDAARQLREAGHTELADRIDTELTGRNVLKGRWTFQIVEDYDDGYWSTVRELERTVRDELTDGKRHVYEAELKEDRRTHGLPGHEARPPEV
ncbi:hypothetical protein EV189_3558 [Motilibacter rhizosphaerae]|uniref:Uncharacterized protein n=1 Tax=Motilibacter rhizosphaerae TaxID=598652 RepID=A0A4Q7NAV3_9ACTN|nr:hypothetical protein [Motilibacter rhizosphaerae]RZS80078.1 hypothetical protein EV189_3558 [Motilibacter rhizosphaerae]